mgnify:FL=1
MLEKNLELEEIGSIDRRTEHTTVMPLFGDSMMDIAIDESKLNLENIPILALRDVVPFPGITVPLSVGRFKSLCLVQEVVQKGKYFALITQRNNAEDPTVEDLYEYGTIAEVVKELEMPDGTHSVIVQVRRLCKLLELTQTEPYLAGRVAMLEEGPLNDKRRTVKAMLSVIRNDIQKMSGYNDENLSQEMLFSLHNIKDNTYFINYLCSAFPLSTMHREILLEITNYEDRLFALAQMIGKQLDYSRIKNHVQMMTHNELNNQQRQHFLRTQIKTIQDELGESSTEDVDKLLLKANLKNWKPEVQEVFRKELNKLQRTNDQSPDYGVLHNYLNIMVDLPWGKITKDNLNLKNAKRVLEHDHYGLDKIKERILEHLAVLKLRGDMKAPILCLVGPPGVGKTSLGRSIASALKRKYVRVSLGGLHDEAEIRGHRRTYIGAMPGRIITGIQRAGTDNPVFVLDEIDKISRDFKGDPSSALLEVLDPEQNVSFHDNYLDVDYDLSKVLFIATANSLSTIDGPLRDRMEVINLSGYVVEEKVEIGERHLLPRQMSEHGLDELDLSIPKPTMEQIIDRYTRESGVRGLEKQLAKLMRRVAWRVANDLDVPAKLKADDLEEYLGKPDFNPEKYDGNEYAGVVTGLAWTSVGGTILEVESVLVKGKGGLSITGNLGDVMKESTTLALQWIKANAEDLNIPMDIFEKYTAHVHFPEGATPKDGPSAGITIVTSLVSTLTQRKVRKNIAMTGEITLRGKVIPVGGIKEKILAAKRAGITDIVMCIDNKKDIEEINALYTKGLTFHYVRDIHEVLDYALLEQKVKNAKSFNL